MAENKEEENADDDILAQFGPGDGDDAATDQAVGDLRGVLENDAEGTIPDLGGGETDLSQFGGDFDAAPGGGLDMPVGDFGGDFGGDLGGGAGLGGMDMGIGSTGGASQSPGSALEANYELIMDIPIDVQIILGTSHMNVATLMNLNEGATIGLERKIGEPVEVMVNGRLIGRGEITVLEEDDSRFGVKLIEVNKTGNKSQSES